MQFLGDARGVLDIGILEHHGEFIARQTGDVVVAPDLLLQQLRGGAQHLVAERVAVSVVDEFETVEIDQQQAHRQIFRQVVGEDHLELTVEMSAVVQAGQRIGDGQMIELVLIFGEQVVELDALGHIAECADDAGEVSGRVGLRIGVEAHPQALAVRRTQGDFAVFFVQARQRARIEIAYGVLVHQKIAEGFAKRIVRGKACQSLPGRIEEHNASVRIELEQDFMHAVDEFAQPCFAVFQQFACFLEALNVVPQGGRALGEGLIEFLDLATPGIDEFRARVPVAVGEFARPFHQRP